MIFPFLEEEAAISVQEYVEPKEYEIDFITGQLTGRVVTGIDAIKAWVWMALKTPRYRYYIYSWDYGQELEELVGKGYSRAFLTCEIESLITECLTINPHIKGIENFEGELVGDTFTATFTVQTDYGEVIADVRGNDLRLSYGTNDG